VEYIQLIGGLLALVLGGEFLVRGAVSIALRIKLSPLVVGMTIVSFGTSAPELLVSLEAVLSGHPDVSVGAVVGSNISNLALVLGITVLIFPIMVNRDSIRFDWPLMFLATILFWLFAMNGVLDSWEGILMLFILISYSTWLIVKSRKEGKIIQQEEEVAEISKGRTIFIDVFYLVLGFAGLYFGAEWLLHAVVTLANEFGVSEKLISVSIVAFGTSLPELVTSAVAAYRKHTDISMGNLIGSNVFNILAILGITSLVVPIQISSEINQLDMYFLLAISILILPIMLFRRRIGLWKGLLLISFYGIYIYFSIVSEI
tara:strand:+ start:787 stop:1734 length:948 start_codon:yes stop_codon:yes gene_type:complete